MTELLEHAIAQLKILPSSEQDAIAKIILTVPALVLRLSEGLRRIRCPSNEK